MGRHLTPAGKPERQSDRPTDAEIERKILSAIGRPVHFHYPGVEASHHGVLRDRIVIRSNPDARGVPYWDVIDIIDFPEADDSPWMRVGYYRYVNGRLVWGSQTTLTEPVSTWKRLFKAAKMRPWFAPVLRV